MKRPGSLRNSPAAKGAIEALNGLFEMFPELKREFDRVEADENNEPPRGQEAVRRTLMDFPGRWWTATSLVDELHSRGWQPKSRDPANAVHVAAERVVSGDPSHFRKATGDKIGGAIYAYWPFDIVAGMANDTYARIQAGFNPPDPEVAEAINRELARQLNTAVYGEGDQSK